MIVLTVKGQDWDALSHIQMMKSLNINKSILSISSPGTHLTPGNDQEARELTRQVNRDMAKICAEHPEHFLFFASLPLPDVEGSLAEIDYALDELSPVGFQILTNSHGIYPGDSRFQRVFDKLSERGATVFFHPTSCNIQNRDGGIERITPIPGVPSPILEFMFDTTRALTRLFTSGTVQMHGDYICDLSLRRDFSPDPGANSGILVAVGLGWDPDHRAGGHCRLGSMLIWRASRSPTKSMGCFALSAPPDYCMGVITLLLGSYWQTGCWVGSRGWDRN